MALFQGNWKHNDWEIVCKKDIPEEKRDCNKCEVDIGECMCWGGEDT